MARSEAGRLADKLDQLLDLDKTCDLEQFYDGKKWRALLRAAERMRGEFLPCDECKPYRGDHEGHYACRAARGYDRAKARILGEKSNG